MNIDFDSKRGFFEKMIDELVEFSEYDKELADGIKWLDDEARKKGISFYQQIFEILYKHDINAKAKNWLDERNASKGHGRI